MTDAFSNLEAGQTVLPPAIEIATVAAILSRGNNGERRRIIDEAIALCLEASIRYDELVDLRLDQIVLALGDTALLDWVLRRATPSKKLRLYPDNASIDIETKKQFFEGGLDQVRCYLQSKASYLNMLKTRSVLETIKSYFLKTAFDHNERNADMIQDFEKQIRRLARKEARESERTVTPDEMRNGLPLRADQARRNGEREYEDFMNQAAVRLEGSQEDSHSDHGCERHLRLGNVLYWELPESFLNTLLGFRRQLKKLPGGIRALQFRLEQHPKKHRTRK